MIRSLILPGLFSKTRSDEELPMQSRVSMTRSGFADFVSRRRNADRFQPRMGATGTRLQAIEIGADVGAGQVQHLAPEPPVLLDLPLGFRRPPGKFPVRVAGLRDPTHRCLERRVLELEMNAEARTEVRVTVGDHVDALYGRDRLDIFQALERLDRHADDDVGIGPWRILGRVTGAMAPVSGVHPLPRDAAMADRRGLFLAPHPR